MTAHDAFCDPDAMATMAPPAKRMRLEVASPIVTVTTVSCARLPNEPSVSERLLAALTHGAWAFLTFTDATTVFQIARVFRTDASLLAACVRLLPDFKRLFPDESSVVFRLQDSWVQQLTESVSAPPEAAAQAIATAAFLKKRVAKWCFEYNPDRPNADDDLLCIVQPVLLPLALVRDSLEPVALSPTTSPAPWSRTIIKDALNVFCPRGGDSFFDTKLTAESRFATHWDSIYVDRVTLRVSCRLCDATRDAIELYKRQVETGLRQHELLLRCQETTWATKTPAERERLVAEFRAKCFPPDAYIRPECAEWPDHRLLRHICEHGKLQAWQIGDTRVRGIASTDALLRAVSFKYQHQCRTFYQPLKKSLHGKCHVVGRIPHAVLRDHSSATAAEDDRVLTEVVGGVDGTTGIFSGVQVTFRLKP